MSFFIKRMTVIGVGLIGGSLAQALKELDLVGEVVGINRSPESLHLARSMGVIDRGILLNSPQWIQEGLVNSQFILVATPVCSIAATIEACAPYLTKGTVITDAGSVKSSIVQRCDAAMPEGIHFVGGHPIAGREHSGVAHAFPSLFQGSRTILTPNDNTSQSALELVRLVWEAVGSHVEIMDAAYHDQVLTATSHLPHLMAYNVVNTLSDLEDEMRKEVFRYAAGGFRDFTRIASSDPSMWRDICLENRTAVLDILARFKTQLEKLMDRIDQQDAPALQNMFARSKSTRDRVLEQNKILRGEP